MKYFLPLLLSSLAILAALAAAARPAAESPLTLRHTVALDGIAGRLDHMAIDLQGQRLFLAAHDQGSVEVIDLARGRRASTISPLAGPQGVLYLPDLNRLVVASGGDGTVRFFDGRSLRPLQTVGFGSDAANLRYDSAAQRVYVGYGSGGLAALDPQTGQKLADIKLDGHPEGFALETKGNRIFVNVPSARRVAVVDRDKRAVVDIWPLADYQANFPMALDEPNARLFIACRAPARLLVLDTRSGRIVAALDCAGDADDLFYDPQVRRLYLSGGEGRVDVFGQIDPDHYRPLPPTPTASGARTSLLAPSLQRLHVAVPRLLLRPASLLVFATE